jgi:uncharacterized protein
MSLPSIDPDGYILNPCNVNLISADFKPLLQETIRLLKAHFEDLHSVYLYGSIARGEAIPYRSDLDISVIFENPVTEAYTQTLKTLAQQLAQKHVVITKVDFDPGGLTEVLDKQEFYRWHFWLRHCCCCIWGSDLGLKFPRQKPHPAIAAEFAKDLQKQLNDTRAALSPENVILKGRSIAKKLIRTAYGRIAPQDNSWHQKIEDCAEAVLRHDPTQQTFIEAALTRVDSQTSSMEQVTELMNSYGQWLLDTAITSASQDRP